MKLRAWVAPLAALILIATGLDAHALGRGRGRGGGASNLLAPATLTGSTWPAGANARYDWAYSASTNGLTHAFWAADIAMPASNLPQAGLIHGRDTSGAQRHMQVTINTVGGVVVALSPAVATAYATCTTGAATMVLSQRTVVAFRFEGLAATNATRLRVWTAPVINDVVGAVTERACTFAGTIPAAWSNDVTTAPWSIGQQFNGTLPLRSATIYRVALWGGFAPDLDQITEIMQARDWSSTSAGAPTLSYSFNGSTVTETVYAGAGGLTGTAPSVASAGATRNRTTPTLTPGCGLASNSGSEVAEAWRLPVVVGAAAAPRNALVVFKSSYNASTPNGLVIVAHGCGYSASTMRGDELAAASSGIEALGNNVVYVYLEGLAGPRGYEIECPPATQPGWTSEQIALNPDALYLDQVIRAVQSRACIDPTRIVGMGRSMGGAFINAVAGYQPTRFRAIGTLVSVYRAAGTWAAAVPAIQTGNAQDNLATDTGGPGGTPLVFFARDAMITANGCSSSSADPSFSECLRYSCSGAPLDVCISDPNATHSPSVQSRQAIVSFFQRQAGL